MEWSLPFIYRRADGALQEIWGRLVVSISPSFDDAPDAERAIGVGSAGYDTAAPRAPPYIDPPVGAGGSMRGGACRVFTMGHNKERENLGVGGVYLAVF